jgi:hypothetical protein
MVMAWRIEQLAHGRGDQGVTNRITEDTRAGAVQAVCA